MELSNDLPAPQLGILAASNESLGKRAEERGEPCNTRLVRNHYEKKFNFQRRRIPGRLLFRWKEVDSEDDQRGAFIEFRG